MAPLDNTYVCTSMGRTTPDGNSPQPWTWLRVHAVTSNAAIGYEALEQLAPGQVVVDNHGRAIPLVIPAGEMGPKMLQAVHRQIHEAMASIRAAVRAHHNSHSKKSDTD